LIGKLTFGGDLHGHQSGRNTAGAVLRGPELFEQFVPHRLLLFQFSEAFPVGFEFSAAHAAFLAGAGLAFGQHVNLAVLGQEFYPQLRANVLPWFFGQRGFVTSKAGFGGTDKVGYSRVGGA